MVNCPECDAVLEIPTNAITGEILPCQDCGVELEIINLDPLTVDVAPQEMEDWGE